MADVVLDNVVKCYGDTEVLHGLDLNIADHEFVVLVGPSGCGKSTTLRIIAGLEDVTAGRILIGGRVVNTIAPKHRNVAMVFQNYALYPHMNVYDNMSFGLKLRKTGRKEIDTRVREAARMLDIEALLHRKPSQLSGGQRQRVAMGRAIVRTPDVFLFDEPLSNLDAQLRAQMRIDIKQLHQRIHATAIYVTHDQVEAMTLGDRIVVMRDGHVEQVGPPEALFWKPANTFVAGFIGNPPMNLLRAEVVHSSSERALKLGPDVLLPLAAQPDLPMPRDDKVIVGIRSQDITPANDNGSTSPAWRIAGVIDVIEPHGNETYLHIDLHGQKAMARCSHRHRYRVNDRVNFTIDPGHLHLFDAATTRRI